MPVTFTAIFSTFRTAAEYMNIGEMNGHRLMFMSDHCTFCLIVFALVPECSVDPFYKSFWNISPSAMFATELMSD